MTWAGRQLDRHVHLVKFEADDGLTLNGLVAESGSDATVVHVHGKCGNFYENAFIQDMIARYTEAGLNFLAFNNRGHGCVVEAYRHGRVVYVGGSIEEFTECVLDIGAAVRFAATFSQTVVLQGHSHGCEKVLHYVQTTGALNALILLSPADSHRLQQQFLERAGTRPESVERQVARLRASFALREWEWLPRGEYGIAADGVGYDIPATTVSFVSLVEGPAFRVLRLDVPWTGPRLDNTAWAYVGGSDPLQVEGPLRMSAGLHERLANVKVVVMPNGDHHLRPVVDDVLRALVQWIPRAHQG